MTHARVLIAYKSLPRYRLDFYSCLRSVLAERNVDLHFAYGDAVGDDAAKSDSEQLPWATYRPNRTVSVAGRRAVWQPIGDEVGRADLVIVEQASKLLLNYLLLARQVRGRGRVAFWGHGGNLQKHTASHLSELLKARASRLPHWWFAYTEGSMARVKALGYPVERITVVQNAIDTRGLTEAVEAVTSVQRRDHYRTWGLTSGRTALYIGSLYPEKRLGFLIDSAAHLGQTLPGFRLLVAGDGPDRHLVETAADRSGAIVYLGRLDGAAKATALAVSDVVLMPGLVGLAVLDAFAAQTPMITTDIDYHSPEIEYLIHDENGLLLPRRTTPRQYAELVASTLQDPTRLRRLRAGCSHAAQRYTNEAMVQRFANGIMLALAAPERH